VDGIRGTGRRPMSGLSVATSLLASLLVFATANADELAIPQKNVNAIGPTPTDWLRAGKATMQQNEAEGASSPNHPDWIAVGYNDYRLVNAVDGGDAVPGMSMSRDGGLTWISGAHPEFGMPGGADPNLEAVPYMLFYNFISFFRDDSAPGAVKMSRWYEHNRDVGPPWEFLDTVTISTGTSGKFLDKPAFKAALRNPDLHLPDMTFPIPTFDDPRNPANSHDAYTLHVPATRLHLCYSVFVGNDNNDGTKIECLASDDGGNTWPIKNRISESVEINQGAYIATRNHGEEVLIVWTRFQDNNENAAIMYAYSTDAGLTYSKGDIVTEFCPFNQGTGPARFRTNALPVAVSAGDGFGVYFSARNDGGETCIIRGKGSNPDTPRMSPVGFKADFDSFGETVVDGVRTKDGFVRTALNFSRILMVRSSGGNKLNWSTPAAIDPLTQQFQVLVNGQPQMRVGRKHYHQFMPSCAAAGGIETCSWYDTRLDKLNNLPTPIASGFVEDYILHLQPKPGGDPAAKVTATILPAGLYDREPPPPYLPPTVNNVPLRRTLDVFAAQIVNGSVRNYTVDADYYPAAGGTSSPSTRVTRFKTRLKPGGAAGEREQVEWFYPNGRLFQKGKAPFISDYNGTWVVESRKRQDGSWISNQDAPNPALDFYPSMEPTFHVGWTDNRNVRGKVFWTGCDTWDPVLEMWSGDGCPSTYTEPNDLVMLPLQGEDGSEAGGPPLQCVDAGQVAPLTRNQDVFVAAMRPGISAEVVTAIKRPEGGINTFVINLSNGTLADKLVRLSFAAGNVMSFDRDGPDVLTTIDALLPKGSTNTRTVFDFGNADTDPGLADTVVLTVADAGNPSTVYASIALQRSSLAPLENVQTNDDVPLDLVGDGEFYNLILKRELGAQRSLDLENLDLENSTVLLDLENLDLENLDLENRVVFLDLENLDLENLDLENVLYQNLDLENIVVNLDLENLDLENRLLFLDLENLDLENLDLENLDLENLDLENLDLENLDLENLDLENLNLTNLDLENLDLENLDLENITTFAADLENLDLENLDLENSPLFDAGDPYTEVSWTADSGTNTTTGVDVRPIFTQTLASAMESAGTAVLLTVRQGYLTATVSTTGSPEVMACQPRVVAENQLLFAAVLSPAQLASFAFNGSIEDPPPDVSATPGFAIGPDQSTIVSLRFINPPAGFDFDTLNANTGMALFTQPGGAVNCDAELPGDEIDSVCEVDFNAPDTTEPVITGLPEDPPPGTPFLLAFDQGTYHYEVTGISANDDVDGPIDVTCSPGTLIDSTGGVFSYAWDFTVGFTTVTCTATDAAGNTATATFTAEVQDVTAPVITLNPPNPQYIVEGNPYVELGATATDNVDSSADLAAVLVIDSSAVNTAVPGSYPVTYNVSDSSDNAATEVVRTVNVTDGTPPVIQVISNPLVVTALANPVTVTEAQLDANVTVTDAIDGVIDPSCSIAGSPLTIGNIYTATCTATDAAGNSATATFNVDIRFAYNVTILIANGSKQAGSVIPVDWYYTSGGSRVDSGSLPVSIRWEGPYGANCSGPTDNSGSGQDAGSSGFRYSASQQQWQYSWQTPAKKGSYWLVISPPGNQNSRTCVALK